ncbi:glycosyl hydrolase family 47 protein [Metarhizium guizhouense ARSEF 977]|uniref:Glycosyl hydrolase family 47 protein n=1 Tax=Metarhizium guizhouense (strain ARSEF 977) TaxID=1276136 RepID=A0A0B4I9U6_METGA|nr:glycosyl hydrolase family 47 protein [Metarhizium guizhouense ARSEF 977]
MASRSAPARTLCSSTSPRCTSCSEEARTSTRPWPGPFWTRRPASIVSSAPGRKPSGTTRGGERKPHLPEGFTAAKDLRYILRPEAIESVFYMYRITGDKAFQTRRGTCSPPSTMKTDYANAAVLDVIVARYPLPKVDYMETVTAQLITNPPNPI